MSWASGQGPVELALLTKTEEVSALVSSAQAWELMLFAFGVLGLDPGLGLVVYVILRVRTVVANGLLTPFAFVTWKPRRVAAPAVSNSPLPVR